MKGKQKKRMILEGMGMEEDNRQLNADRTFGHCQVLDLSASVRPGSVNRVILIPEVRFVGRRVTQRM